MPRDKTPWERAGWQQGAQFGDGNQGHTFLARREHDPEDQYSYVLKRLKRQKELTRRKRMHVEAQALKVVEGNRVSRLVDTNAEDFADIEIDLYIVTEFIRGPNLEEARDQFATPLKACELIGNVLETLK
jgi:hypothetical protein